MHEEIKRLKLKIVETKTKNKAHSCENEQLSQNNEILHEDCVLILIDELGAYEVSFNNVRIFQIHNHFA